MLQQTISTTECKYIHEAKGSYAKQLLHQKNLTPEHVYTRKPLTGSALYTKVFLHQKAFTPEPFYTK